MDDRNFKIKALKVAPILSWQVSGRARLSGSFAVEERRSSRNVESPGTAMINEISGEFRYSNATKSSLLANFRYIDIDFTGIENSALGYELLNALRPGQNFVWIVNFQKSLTSGLQLNLVYEGRKSPAIDLIHIGRVQATALF